MNKNMLILAMVMVTITGNMCAMNNMQSLVNALPRTLKTVPQGTQSINTLNICEIKKEDIQYCNIDDDEIFYNSNDFTEESALPTRGGKFYIKNDTQGQLTMIEKLIPKKVRREKFNEFDEFSYYPDEEYTQSQCASLTTCYDTNLKFFECEQGRLLVKIKNRFRPQDAHYYLVPEFFDKYMESECGKYLLLEYSSQPNLVRVLRNPVGAKPEVLERERLHQESIDNMNLSKKLSKEKPLYDVLVFCKE